MSAFRNIKYSFLLPVVGSDVPTEFVTLAELMSEVVNIAGCDDVVMSSGTVVVMSIDTVLI